MIATVLLILVSVTLRSITAIIFPPFVLCSYLQQVVRGAHVVFAIGSRCSRVAPYTTLLYFEHCVIHLLNLLT